MVEPLPRICVVLGSRLPKAVAGTSITLSIKELDGHREEAVKLQACLNPAALVAD